MARCMDLAIWPELTYLQVSLSFYYFQDSSPYVDSDYFSRGFGSRVFALTFKLPIKRVLESQEISSRTSRTGRPLSVMDAYRATEPRTRIPDENCQDFPASNTFLKRNSQTRR